MRWVITMMSGQDKEDAASQQKTKYERHRWRVTQVQQVKNSSWIPGTTEYETSTWVMERRRKLAPTGHPVHSVFR